MSDWQAGDLALCVNDALIRVGPVRVKKGCIYTVEAVVFFHAEGLHLQNTDAGSAYLSSRFVKITPGHTITGQSFRIVEQYGKRMNRGVMSDSGVTKLEIKRKKIPI